MLANTKHTYALSMWTVEKRPNGWYFSKSAYHGDRHDWRGPYASEFSVTLMIARELQKEIKNRHGSRARGLIHTQSENPDAQLTATKLYRLYGDQARRPG